MWAKLLLRSQSIMNKVHICLLICLRGFVFLIIRVERVGDSSNLLKNTSIASLIFIENISKSLTNILILLCFT